MINETKRYRKTVPWLAAVRKNPGSEDKSLPVEIGKVTKNLRAYLVEDDPLAGDGVHAHLSHG